MLNLSEQLHSVFFTGYYSETVNDAKVAIESQPHFLKAFVTGNSDVYVYPYCYPKTPQRISTLCQKA